MAKVAVRIIRTYDAVIVEAEWGDTPESLLARASIEGIEPVETRILVGRLDAIEAAVALAEAAKPDEPKHARAGVWSASEMNAEDYERRQADLKRNPADDQAKADIEAYEEAN